MNYDEIDDYVNGLFGREPLDGDIITDGGRGNRIDQVIEDAYQDVLRWHNQRISAGPESWIDTDPPISGMRGLPWDEKIDGVAAMQRATGGSFGASLERNGAQWVRVGGEWVAARNVTKEQARQVGRSGYTCGGFAAALVMLVMLCAIGGGVILWLEGIVP